MIFKDLAMAGAAAPKSLSHKGLHGLDTTISIIIIPLGRGAWSLIWHIFICYLFVIWLCLRYLNILKFDVCLIL